MDRIDSHHHILPSFFRDALIEKFGGDPASWHLPNWSPEQFKTDCLRLNIRHAIVSVTSNGAAAFSGAQGRTMARQLNEYSAHLQQDGEKFMFSCLPSMLDTQGCLDEIDFSYSVLKCRNFVLSTSYSDENRTLYCGSTEFLPIWEKIASIPGSVVFLHPCPSGACLVKGEGISTPLLDFPHETARAATSLVFSGIRKSFPSLPIILSHSGGTLLAIVDRIALSGRLGLGQKSREELLSEFKLFFFDVAVSFSNSALEALLNFASSDRILFGSDIPYLRIDAAEESASWLATKLSHDKTLHRKIMFQNAASLFSLDDEREKK